MRENRKKLYILCGLTSKAEEDVKNALIEKAEEAGYEAVCVSRYRKEGIRQYIEEHPEFRIVLLQESMQSNYPYTAEELAELMDDYNLNIIISLRKSHRANVYMKILYTAGILNALFEEDASAANIMNLILYPRTRKECREYYQITNAADVMATLEIVDEQKMQGYLEYIEDSDTDSEMKEKYRYVAKSVKIIENIYLTRHLSENAKAVLKMEDEFQKYLELQFQHQKHWRPFRKKRQHSRERPMPGPEKTLSQSTQVENNKGQEVQKRENRTNIEEMVDEDISDLLGFDSVEDIFDTKDLYPSNETAEKQNDLTEVRATTRKKGEKHSIVFKIGMVVAVSVCLIIILLFGIFLITDYQASKEKNMPIISQGIQSSESKKGEGQEKVTLSKTNSKPIEDQKHEEKTTEKKIQLQQEEVQSESKGTEQSAESQGSQESDIQSEPPLQEKTSEPNHVAEPEVEVPPPSESVSVSTSEPESGADLSQPEESVSYVGKILTGAEVAEGAGKEENKGAKLYLKTREGNEGYFSASQIAAMVDNACSYLVEGSSGVQISFIQQ